MAKTTTTTAPAKSAKPSKADLTALELAARDTDVTELVTRYHTADKAQSTADAQADAILSTVEQLKNEAKDMRVRQARSAYLLATHPEIAGKKASNLLAASRRLVTIPGMTDKEIDKAARNYNPTFRYAFLAGEALAAKGYVFYSADPTESERAIVEKSYDETLRAKSAKGNAKTKAKTEAAKGENSEGGEEKPLAETVIPTAEGIISALETVVGNIAKFKSDAGFSPVQAAAIHALLATIAAEVPEED